MKKKIAALQAYQQIQGLALQRSERELAVSVTAFKRNQSLMNQLDVYLEDYQSLNETGYFNAEPQSQSGEVNQGRAGLVGKLANGNRFLGRLNTARAQQQLATRNQYQSMQESRTGWRKKYESHRALRELIAKRQMQMRQQRQKEEDAANMESWLAIAEHQNR